VGPDRRQRLQDDLRRNPHATHTPQGPVVDIGGGKEHLCYQTESGEVYGIGYNDLYKLNQKKCCAPNVDWPGSLIWIK
jgi:hypothetical protein